MHSTKQLAALAILAVMLTACNMVITPESASEPQGVDLSETIDFADFPFQIDYPSGWEAQFLSPGSVLCARNDDVVKAVGNMPSEDVCAVLDHRATDFMSNMGLPDDPTLDDLLALNADLFIYADPEVTEVEIFGVPALRVQSASNVGFEIAYMGFRGDEVFLLSFISSDGDVLDEFEPTLEAMVTTIRPTE